MAVETPSVEVKLMAEGTYRAVLAVNPEHVNNLFTLEMCGFKLPSGGSCMRPAGHAGDEHIRFVVALAVVETVNGGESK